MNKKRHQGDPGADDSSESCDENDNNVECQHVRQAVDITKVKKALIKAGIAKECGLCKIRPVKETPMEEYYELDNSLWLCLRCGNQACGRAMNKHALEHYKTPHSDSHALCVNTSNWGVWCYDCDEMVNANCRKKLLEAVEYVQKQAESKNGVISRAPEYTAMDLVAIPVIPLPDCSPSSSSTPRPRGLMNLGNTCFFNSVVQCLAQTPYLQDLLQETSMTGQHFQLPGGHLNPKDETSPILEPLEGELEKWRALNSALAETLEEIMNGRGEAYVPRTLLSQLTRRMPQFGGGDQHDSHELLRHLLEAVREEDLKRYQTVILKVLGLPRSVPPCTVEEEKRKVVKFYGQQASELLLPTEQVFRGVLVSMLQCQDCQHTSHRDEFFLDLSLPITEKQVPPVLRRKAEDSEDNKLSKHQIKKEKRAERKKNKKQKSHKNVNALIGPSLPSLDADMEKSDSESDADVEDNIEVSEDATKGVESGYNSDKIDNSSPDSNNRGVSPEMRIDDSGVPSPSMGMLNVSQGTGDNSPASSEANIDMGSPLVASSPDEDAHEYYERPESRMAFVNNKNVDLKTGLSKLSLMNDGDSSKIGVLDNDKMEDDDTFEGACGGEIPEDEKMDEDDEDVDLWSTTISARYQCEEGEYSVQSCLNQFTACELMTGNNKVSCELCTKRHAGSEKKTVYTNATKQLLIYNPPAVLILHLKRFQVLRFRSAKVSKLVKFPTLLDLAPFCSKRSQNLPTFEAGQTKVLYSLYGVVEHSGSMHGGHYVAYVKVRPKLEATSYRWQFLPKNQKNDKSNLMRAPQSEPEVPTGRWYYISDSHVSEVNEAKVLGAQAYLLFYERIM